MSVRLKAALADGVILGVKYGVALLVVVLMVSWALRDYAIVREQARNGQIAFQTWQQQLQAQKVRQENPQ